MLLLLLYCGRLMLLLHPWRLMLLLLPRALLLLLLRGRLLLLLPWALSLHRRPLALQVLRVGLIARFHLFRHTNVVVSRERLVDGHTGWAAMVDVGELSPVAAGRALILELRPHRRSMLLMASHKLSGSGAHLQSA